MRFKLSCLIGAAMFISFLSPLAKAEDSGRRVTEEELLFFMEIPNVISSTLRETTVQKVPSVMTVITEKEIKNMGAVTLMDLIGRIPGFVVSDKEIRRKLITFRGITSMLTNDKFKLLINGHTVVEPMWGDFTNFYNIDLDNVKQVEIIRGAGSALYGTNAFAAVINVITKDPKDMDNCKVNVKYQSFNNASENIAIAKKTGDLQIGINANMMNSDGPDTLIDRDLLSSDPFGLGSTGLTPAKDNEKDKYNNVFLNIKYKDFSLDSSYADSKQHWPVGQYAFTEHNDDTEYTYDFVEAKYNFSISDSLVLRTKVSMDTIKYEDALQVLPTNIGIVIASLYGTAWTNGPRVRTTFDSSELNGEAVLDYSVTENNKLLLGFFYDKTDINNINLYANISQLDFSPISDNLIKSPLNWNKDSSRTIQGAFFQDELNINKDLYLILGGRYDSYSDFGTTFNPRTGLVWNFNKEKSGIAKFLYGTAFKAPTASQLYNRNNPVLVGNPDLKAETEQSTELAFGYNTIDKLHSDLSIWSLKTDNLIDYADYTVVVNPATGQTAQTLINRGKTEAWGIELDNKYYFKGNNYLSFAYYYTGEAKDSITGNKLPWIPQSLVNVGLNLNFLSKCNWNTSVIYTGERPREVTDTRSAIEATTVIDTCVRFQDVIKNFDLALSVNNLTNTTIVTPSEVTSTISDLPRPGITYGASASYKF